MKVRPTTTGTAATLGRSTLQVAGETVNPVASVDVATKPVPKRFSDTLKSLFRTVH
jgi:hypothetical protein